MINGGDLDGPFAQGDELLQRISVSKDVKSCFAQHYFEFAIARPLASEDQCSIDPIKRDFVASGDLRALVSTVARSDAFRLRMSEGAEP